MTGASAGFVFRAQAVLDLRQRAHEQAQRKLAEAESSARAARDALASARNRLQENLARATAAEAQAADAAILAWYRNWLSRTRRDIAACEKAVAARDAQARQARTEAVRAHRDLKSIERLRERAWRAFLAGERRAEQKALDWLGGVRHIRRTAAAKEDS